MDVGKHRVQGVLLKGDGGWEGEPAANTRHSQQGEPALSGKGLSGGTMGGAGWLAGPGVVLREGPRRMLVGVPHHTSQSTLYVCVHPSFQSVSNS